MKFAPLKLIETVAAVAVVAAWALVSASADEVNRHEDRGATMPAATVAAARSTMPSR
jgi:hypothetical protein